MIKDRVQEIKNEPDWKQKMADEWNATTGEPQQDQKSQVTQSKCTNHKTFLQKHLNPVLLNYHTQNVWNKPKKKAKPKTLTQAP